MCQVLSRNRYIGKVAHKLGKVAHKLEKSLINQKSRS
ncbi:hypothetical protein J2S13_000589 [Oikeobacillus pervagus]|uniref:Uncharacterized protein n=1 Tax=Oikeobacillus pervagus TaxID=1325931 RepID=A0AAJ1SWL2_9BACI|nr:hypothetical protein [Oikeobacillus pervagus]